MSIPSSQIDLKTINRDLDLAENTAFKSDAVYRRRNAKAIFDSGNTAKPEDPKGGPISFTDVANSAMCLQPYAGKYNSFQNSEYVGRRDRCISSDQDGSSLLVSTDASVYTGWLGYALWLSSTIKPGNYGIYVGCIGRHWAELPENTDFKVHYQLGTYGNNKGKPQCEVHGYRDGPASGNHKMFGYKDSAAQRYNTLGPWNCGTNNYIMFSTACFVSGSTSGQNVRQDHQFLNIWLEIL